MSKYDEINEVKKADSIDHIEEVEKFNPFHDSLGKFSSSNGFKSYSANPKTKAGAMAIQRSAAAGHGRTMNVHRESKGESIAQNDRWLKTGQKPKVPAAVSRARYQQRKLKQQQAAQQAQQNQQNQAQQKPAPKKPTQTTQQNQQQAATQNAAPKSGSLAADVAGVKVTASEAKALTARNARGSATTTRKLADDNYQERVVGKDITKSVDVRNISGGGDPIDKIARAQGWNKAPTVTNDKAEFDAAAKQSGRVMYRTVDPNSRLGLSSDQVAKATMSDGNIPLGGNGGKVYGSGLYLVDASLKNGIKASDMQAASRESFCYGNRQMMATVHPSAKIATTRQARQLQSEFFNLSRSDQARFGRDVNSYIASKGYDGAKWHDDSDPTAYTTMYNKSAMIFYGGVANNR